MKSLAIVIILLALICCKKQPLEIHSYWMHLEHVKTLLKDSLSSGDFSNLDFNRAVQGKLENGKTSYLRIPLATDNYSEFVLIEMDSANVVFRSRIITINKVIEANENSSNALFNGTIVISSLRRKVTLKYEVVDGSILEIHDIPFASRGNNVLVVPGPKQEIVTSVETTGENAPTTWISMPWLTGGSHVGQPVGYISVSNDPSPLGGGGSGSGIIPEAPILIDFEPLVESLKAIDIQKYLKCFETVPDAGAVCSIEILSDIPVDTDPNKLFNVNTGSPGHTFLQIKKSNGRKMVMQNIGFYPVDGWKTIMTPAPINGKFVDNGSHEFNAGLIQKITPDQLKRLLTHISYLSRFIRYDIDDYNCTDFALDVFNQVRISNYLEIPKYDLPGGMAPNGSSTPQGLYNKLKSMQDAGVESANINIPGVKGWVSGSLGPCN